MMKVVCYVTAAVLHAGAVRAVLAHGVPVLLLLLLVLSAGLLAVIPVTDFGRWWWHR